MKAPTDRKPYDHVPQEGAPRCKKVSSGELHLADLAILVYVNHVKTCIVLLPGQLPVAIFVKNRKVCAAELLLAKLPDFAEINRVKASIVLLTGDHSVTITVKSIKHEAWVRQGVGLFHADLLYLLCSGALTRALPRPLVVLVRVPGGVVFG